METDANLVEPCCDKCGAPITTGLMAVFCPNKERCEFWPTDSESVAFIQQLRDADGAESMVKRYTWSAEDHAMRESQELGDFVRLSDYHALMDELQRVYNTNATNAQIVAELDTAFRDLMHAYVCLLESGRDRIKMLGGDCDDVPTMEANDPALIRARDVLTPAQRDSDGR